MRYGTWMEVRPPSVLDDLPVLRSLTDLLVEKLWRNAEAEGVAVDLSTVDIETSRAHVAHDRVVVMARADVGYEFRPLGERIAEAVRWRKWWRP